MVLKDSTIETARGELLSIVIPAYNEALSISKALEVVAHVFDTCGETWEAVFVDDGSRDETFDRIRELAHQNRRVRGIRLSRNFGKEAALLAGLKVAKGDAVITMDCDLQHPPALIPSMIEAWRSGAKVVDAVKRSRSGDSVLSRVRAKVYNGFLSILSGMEFQNSSDFKLLDRTVVDVITQELPERHRFFRGLSSWVGFEHETILFDVEKRAEGRGKWSLWELISLALTATVAFTSAPLRVVSILGVASLLLGIIVGTDALISWYKGNAVSGFVTTIMVLMILGSLIMISLGIIGEYIGKIYDEIKQRPPFLVQDTVGFESKKRISKRKDDLQ